MPKRRLLLSPTEGEFESVPRSAVPHQRKGKHNALVSRILSGLLTLEKGSALKVPLLDLRKEKIENVRAAVNRAGRKLGYRVGTSCDDYFFYVWVNDKNTNS